MGKVLFIVGFNINLLVIKVFKFMGAYLYVFKMVEFINQQNQNSTPPVFVQKQPIKTKSKKDSVKEVHSSPPLTVRKSPTKDIKPKVSFKSDIQPVKEDQDEDYKNYGKDPFYTKLKDSN